MCIRDSFYRVGLERLTFTEILERFVDPSKKSGNFHRISDMHVKIGMPISFRTDDELVPVEKGTPISAEAMLHMLSILLTEKQVAQVTDPDSPQDVDTAFEWEEQGINFRLNVFRDRDGLAYVMRVLSSTIPSIENVGLPSEAIWQDITSLKRGLVLVTGVTGSGKSTCLLYTSDAADE